jgi:hypothetical protein
MICLENHISEVAPQGQSIWNSVGNRLVEAYIRGNSQATEREFEELGVSFAVLSQLLKFRSSRGTHFEVKRDKSRSEKRFSQLVPQDFESAIEFKLKEISR